jgi:hypothetical protein
MGAKEYGTPGEWAKIKGTVVSIWPLFLCFTFAGAFAASIIFGKYVWVFFTLLIVVLISMMILWNRGLTRIKSYFLGAVGEARVASELRKLPDGYHVIHDFSIGNANFVDHVVMGPTGVFAVETKDWYGVVDSEEGHIIRDGDIPPFSSPIKQAKDEARKVEKTMRKKGWDGSVVPVLCFASNNYVKSVEEVKGVKVANADQVVELITSMPAILSPDAVERNIKLAGI